MKDFPFDPYEPAFPSPETQSNREAMGLSILEYAAIQICASLNSNPGMGHEMSMEQLARMAVAQARTLFAELNRE